MNSPAWAKLEPIRVRIMQEAYDCADRDEPEAYNSIKVMCGEVLVLVDELIKAEREACAKVCEEYENDMGYGQPQQCANAIRARG
jgi:hypothetical protein